MKVVITDFISRDDPLQPEKSILGAAAEIVSLDAHKEDELVGMVEDADAIMIYHLLPALSAKTIKRLRRCKLIVRGGVGYDNVDWAAARERGIPVANVPDYGTEEVADSAIGMTLSLTRGIGFLNSRLRDGQGPWMYHQAKPLQRLRGRVFGIIGLGRIGSAAALRAKALAMDVAFFDPFKPDGFDKALGVRRVDTLDELLSQAHVLSLHCPLTAQTHHMIDAVAIGKMRPGSYLVNTARGGVLDTTAIPEAISSGRLAGAGIDVLEHEPPGDDDVLVRAWKNPEHPAYHRVLINPHAAFYSEQGLMEIRLKASEACRRAVSGEMIRNVVN